MFFTSSILKFTIFAIVSIEIPSKIVFSSEPCSMPCFKPLQEKKKDLEIAIIAPGIKYAHSTKERVNIKSIIDTEKWLEKVINKLQ